MRTQKLFVFQTKIVKHLHLKEEVSSMIGLEKTNMKIRESQCSGSLVRFQMKTWDQVREKSHQG